MTKFQLTTRVKLSAIVLEERSLCTYSVEVGALVFPSCCWRNASMKGVRVRMAVSSWYTPSVRHRRYAVNERI